MGRGHGWAASPTLLQETDPLLTFPTLWCRFSAKLPPELYYAPPTFVFRTTPLLGSDRWSARLPDFDF